MGFFRSDQLGVWFMFILLSPWVSLANDEGDALIAFKNGLKDPQNNFRSWDPTYLAPCQWFHIRCDDPHNPDKVTRIDLEKSGLSGPLTAGIGLLGSLKHLQYLNLYENHFTGHIPAEIGNLTNLVSLKLYSNSLTGNLPVELGNLYNLRFLWLQNNNLCGRPPVEEIAKRWANGPFHGNKDISIQLYPGNKNLCNPFKDKFCVPGCCKYCK